LEFLEAHLCPLFIIIISSTKEWLPLFSHLLFYEPLSFMSVYLFFLKVAKIKGLLCFVSARCIYLWMIYFGDDPPLHFEASGFQPRCLQISDNHPFFILLISKYFCIITNEHYV
jgi:hypothetical protein